MAAEATLRQGWNHDHDGDESMTDLTIYKRMPEWSAETLPQGFRRKHNTKEGTWAQLTLSLIHI